MERYIGMDVHAASCTLAVISEKGRKLKDFPVETNGQALVEVIRMIPGHKHLVMEKGLQSAWLYETLSPHVDELVVAGITQSRGPKSDNRDAYGLAEKLRVGNLDKYDAYSHSLRRRLQNFRVRRREAIAGSVQSSDLSQVAGGDPSWQGVDVESVASPADLDRGVMVEVCSLFRGRALGGDVDHDAHLHIACEGL